MIDDFDDCERDALRGPAPALDILGEIDRLLFNLPASNECWV